MNSQENHKEGSTLDGRSKNSFPDTPMMTICDAQYFEAMKEHMEACSKVTNPIIEAPTIDQLPV